MRTCKQCGKEFETYNKGDIRIFCSKKCSSIAKQKRVKKQCIICGKEFEVPDYAAETAKVCGRKCLGQFNSINLKKYYKEHPKKRNWILVKCPVCSKQFETFPYMFRKNPNITCSRKCRSKLVSLKYQQGLIKPSSFKSRKLQALRSITRLVGDIDSNLRFRKFLVQPNSLEVKLFDLFTSIKYVGNKQVCVRFNDGRNKFPDFIVEPFEATKKVIEVAGLYWHTKEEMEEIQKKYAEVGINCLIVYDYETQDMTILKEKVFKFITNLTCFQQAQAEHLLLRGLYDGDVGLDLRSTVDVIIPKGGYRLVPCGIKIKIPKGYYGNLVGRSSLAKQGVFCHNGTIDNGFTGELGPWLYNLGEKAYSVSEGDKVCQIVIKELVNVDLVEVTELSQSERGEKGFGSSGK